MKRTTPATDRWRTLAPIPPPRDHLAAAAADGRLFAIGGRVDGSYARNLQANESYDPTADRWEALAPLPTARSGIAAAVLDGRIIVGGGETPPAPSIRSRPTTPSTTAGAAMPRCRPRATACGRRPSAGACT